MNLLDEIYVAQRNAGEAAVIANLQRLGLTATLETPHDQRSGNMATKTDADTITRLQGEAHVLIGLLAEAWAVLQTIEPECATEDESLTRLRGDIWAVLQAWAKRGWV